MAETVESGLWSMPASFDKEAAKPLAENMAISLGAFGNIQCREQTAWKLILPPLRYVIQKANAN